MEVVRELVLPAPPQEVWEALTEPERLREWFANDVEREGDELVYRWASGEERRARIDEADGPRRLSFRWSDPEAPDGETRVTFELEPAEDGTRLVVTESVPEPQAAVGLWSTALDLRASFEPPLALARVA